MLSGSRVEEVCERLKATYQSESVTLTDSGTSALALALRLAAQRRPGQPVLLPAWGCFDLATAVLGASVPVAFYDIDPTTLGPDWDSLIAAARLGPAAAVGVHFYGVPIDWPRFESLLRPSGACLIEDAAQAAGAEVGGRAAGGLGDLTILSFGRGKGTTGGRGGALIVRDRSYLDALGGLSIPRRRGSAFEVGALIAQWVLTRPSLFALPAGLPFLGLGQTIFRPPHPIGGISDFSSGVLTSTMPSAQAEADARRANAAILYQGLGGARVEPILTVRGSNPGWLRMPVRFNAGDAQLLLSDREARGLGIYPSYPKVLSELPELSRLLAKPCDAPPGATELVRRLITFPTH